MATYRPYLSDQVDLPGSQVARRLDDFDLLGSQVASGYLREDVAVEEAGQDQPLGLGVPVKVWTLYHNI